MSITVGDLRRAIEGRPDDEPVERHLVNAGDVDERIDATLTIMPRTSNSNSRVTLVVLLHYLDDDEDDENEDWDDDDWDDDGLDGFDDD